MKDLNKDQISNIKALLNNIRQNTLHLHKIIDRGAIFVGDRETIDDINHWLDLAINEFEK